MSNFISKFKKNLDALEKAVEKRLLLTTSTQKFIKKF